MVLDLVEDDICADNLFLFHKGVHNTLTGIHPLGDDGDGVLGGLIDGVALLGGGVVGKMILATPDGCELLLGLVLVLGDGLSVELHQVAVQPVHAQPTPLTVGPGFLLTGLCSLSEEGFMSGVCWASLTP